MSYLLRSKPRRSKSAFKQVFLVLLLFVVGAGALTLLRGPLYYAVSPVWRGQSVLSRGLANTYAWFSSKDTLVKENTALRERLLSQEAELASLREVKDRELALLGMLGRPEVSDSILASVLVRPPDTPYDILVLDAGSNQGVKEGDKVSMPEGALLGVISEVTSRNSKVKLFSSSGERTNAVLERHSVPVILMGQGGGNFRLTLPRDVEVQEGDRILSAGVGTELMAVVGTINMAPTDAFKEVVARGGANIFSLRSVLIKP